LGPLLTVSTDLRHYWYREILSRRANSTRLPSFAKVNNGRARATA